jgi:hypothetical protein
LCPCQIVAKDGACATTLHQNWQALPALGRTPRQTTPLPQTTSLSLLTNLAIPYLFNNMSSGETQSLISFFDKELLVSLDAVQYALLRCGSVLTEKNVEPFLRDLISQSLSDSGPLLELILSGTFLGSTSIPRLFPYTLGWTGGSCSETLSTWIMNHFPVTRDGYSSSLTFAIIQRLSLFVLFAYPFDRETSELLSLYRHRVELASKVIGPLAAATFSVELEKPYNDEDDLGFIKPQKSSQRWRKRAKRANSNILFDPKLFESLGLIVPKSLKEVETVSKLLIDEHKTILKVHHLLLDQLFAYLTLLQFYLDRLRDADVAATIQQGFIRQDVILESQAAPAVEEQSTPLNIAVDGTKNTPSAYPMVQPMKA